MPNRHLIACVVFAALAPAISAGDYTIEPLIRGDGLHGIHGMSFDSEDRLYVGSVVGMSIYRVDTETGETETYIGPPSGMADDLEWAPDGTLAWTSFNLGKVHARKGEGPIRELATGLPGINSLAFKQDGRLFATQVFLGDALYEIDLEGERPARKIMEDMGGLNGFDFGPDGLLYGPLWFKGQVVKIDVDSGELTVVAEGFEIPAAVNFDSKGALYALDHKAGRIYRIDVSTGEKKVVAEIPTAGDNIAFDSTDRLYVTIIPENAIYEIDLESGERRTVREGRLSVPADISLYEEDGRATLYLADLFAYRAIDAASGEILRTARMGADELEYPLSVWAGERHVWFASWFSGTVQKTDRVTGESLAIWHEFNAPSDVIEIEGGDVIVSELALGRLVRVSGPKGEDRRTVADRLAGPTALASAGEGAVYVTEALAGLITRVDLESGDKRTIASGLRQPEGLAIAADGRIIVAEAGARRITAVDPESGEKEILAEELPIGLKAASGQPPTNLTTGVAVSRSGTIYFTSDLEDAIYRMQPRGRLR